MDLFMRAALNGAFVLNQMEWKQCERGGIYMLAVRHPHDSNDYIQMEVRLNGADTIWDRFRALEDRIRELEGSNTLRGC